MKIIKYVAVILVMVAFAAGCTTEKFDDLSFLSTATAPAKVSALFYITQDNTGLVTITPNGEGGSTYDVYFGDATTKPAIVPVGGNTTHIYPEGVYTVKIVTHGITGTVTESTKQLTVSFKAPENLEVTAAIDVSNKLKVNVSAKALYETVFKVTFGDGGASEVPQSFLEGETVSHIYTAVGTYTIKVVALSGGAASTEYTKSITIVNPVLLPLNFEDGTLVYEFSNFDGGVITVIDNSQKMGINTSSKVGKMVKSAGQTWGGSTIKLGAPIDFSTNKVFMMKVFSPRVGAKVLLKVENPTDNTISFEKEVLTTVANNWEDLAFDYTAIDASKTYQNIVLIFDNGTMGNGTANFTFLFDDIRQTKTMPTPSGITLFNFESGTYTFTNFDGGGSTVIANPHSSGINSSSKVAQMIKSSGQPWGGSWIDYGSPIDFSAFKTFKMKVYSPRIGAKVLLKVENATDASKSFEKEVTTTVANAWEDLTFDYSAINTANTYQHVVIIFDNGTMGDGSANFTFLFDDIRLTTAGPLPLTLYNFETGTYTFTDFDGGGSTIIDNPHIVGINTSLKVAQMIKSAGQVWGGSWIDYGSDIDFSTRKTVKMKVYSPRVGAKVLFKVENATDSNKNYEKEVLTTVANAWEVLTFDYSAINTANAYQHIVLIFDNGTAGDGSANYTFLFDDITLN